MPEPGYETHPDAPPPAAEQQQPPAPRITRGPGTPRGRSWPLLAGAVAAIAIAVALALALTAGGGTKGTPERVQTVTKNGEQPAKNLEERPRTEHLGSDVSGDGP